jgi:hypothetical protein
MEIISNPWNRNKERGAHCGHPFLVGIIVLINDSLFIVVRFSVSSRIAFIF